MPKAKQSKRRKKFNYNTNRKKLKLKFKKAAAPRIECAQIRHAWNERKSVAQNLEEMGLALDPNRSLPVHNQKGDTMEVDAPEASTAIIKKPYVVNEMEAEASIPQQHTKTLSRDMTEYVQYMIGNHNENYKEMAKDEKNYYQDTPKQIRRKVELYKRYHPEEYTTFLESLKGKKKD
ncbi:nucleolar protein 16 [Amia ocellicauda]|uniref:nucleolar protein 16 n=1 Tax=Amia ocellicauda TaxID=2972642 RepID=UPI003463A50C